MNVHQIELRGADHATALRTVGQEVGPGSPLADSSRALVLDDAERLAGRQEVYDAIWTSGRVERLLCVAVGPPRSSKTGPALCRPGQLGGGQETVTVWVGDTTGVGWKMRPPGPAEDHPAVALGSGIGLDRLVEVLRQPEVFDRVIELGAELPEAAASPGLHWSSARTGTDTVLAALARAVGDVTRDSTGPPNAELPTRGGGPLLSFVADKEPPRAPEGAAAGLLTAKRQEFSSAVVTAERAVAAVHGWRGLFGPAHPARVCGVLLPAVRASLVAFRDHAEKLFTPEQLDGRTDEARRVTLQNAGVRESPLSAKDVTEAVEAMRERATVHMRQAAGTAPLHQAAADLDEVAQRLRPGGGALARQRITAVVDTGLLDRLGNAPWFPPVQSFSVLLLPAFVAPLLPALLSGWLGVPLAVLVALAWLYVMVRLLSRTATTFWGRVAVVAVHGAVAGAGGSAGYLLADVARPPSPTLAPLFLPQPHPLLYTLALLVGVLLAAGTVLGYWRSRARQWVTELGLEQTRQCVDTIARHTDQAVWTEYVLAPERRRAADAAVAAAAGLRAVAAALAEGMRDDDQHATTPDKALLEQIHEDLLALTETAMRPVWRTLESGPARDVRGQTREEATRLLDSYVEHLRTDGFDVAPPFVAADAPRGIHSDAWGQDLSLKALNHNERDDAMLQLCDAIHLRLLSPGKQVRTVRFAPQTLRAALRAGADGGDPSASVPLDTIWTSGGQHTGVLRLVPLRAGVVRTAWEHPVAAEEPATPKVDRRDDREARQP